VAGGGGPEHPKVMGQANKFGHKEQAWSVTLCKATVNLNSFLHNIIYVYLHASMKWIRVIMT